MQTESTLPPAKELVSLAFVSLVGTILVLGIKIYAYVQTNSGAVFSDALESLIDILSSILTLFVMRAVASPADEDHPYGHGKLEYFCAAFEGGLITLAAVLIGFGAAKAMLFGHQIEKIDSGLGLLIGSVVMNLIFASYLYRKGTASASQAIIAKSKHVWIDVVTTLAVILGLILVQWTGLVWIDAVVALFVAVHLMRGGIKIIRESIGALIDEVDVKSLGALAKAFNQHREPGIIDIHNLKMIRSGRFHHVDVHLVVPEFWDIEYVHRIAGDFEKKVISTYFYDGEVAFHIDPCHREYCASCELSNCQVRRQAYVQHREFTTESIAKPPVKDEAKS